MVGRVVGVACLGIASLVAGCGETPQGTAVGLDEHGRGNTGRAGRGGGGAGGADCVPTGGTTGTAGAGGGVGGSTGAAGSTGSGGTGGATCDTDTLATCMGTVQDGWCVEQLPPGDMVYFSAIWSSGPKDVWVTGYELDASFSNPRFFMAHNDGCGWTRQPYRSEQLSAIWGSGPSDVWFAGAGGTALHYDGQGFSTFVIDAEAESIRALSGVASNDIWAVSPRGLFHWDGTTWSPFSTDPSIAGAGDVWAAGPNDVWMVKDRTSIHFDGTSFTTAPTPGTQGQMNTVFANEVGIFAGGTGQQLARFQDGAWIELSSAGGSSLGFRDIAGVGADIVMVGNADLWRWDGTAFAPMSVPVSFVGTIWVSSTQIWTTGQDGAIVRRAR